MFGKNQLLAFFAKNSLGQSDRSILKSQYLWNCRSYFADSLLQVVFPLFLNGELVNFTKKLNLRLKRAKRALSQSDRFILKSRYLWNVQSNFGNFLQQDTFSLSLNGDLVNFAKKLNLPLKRAKMLSANQIASF